MPQNKGNKIFFINQMMTLKIPKLLLHIWKICRAKSIFIVAVKKSVEKSFHGIIKNTP